MWKNLDICGRKIIEHFKEIRGTILQMRVIMEGKTAKRTMDRRGMAHKVPEKSKDSVGINLPKDLDSVIIS